MLHIERPSLFYYTYKYQPVPGTSLHLTELSDDVSLCAYLVLQNNHNCDDQKTVVILVILCLSVLSVIM